LHSCFHRERLLTNDHVFAGFPPALQQLVEDPQRLKLGVQIAGPSSSLSPPLLALASSARSHFFLLLAGDAAKLKRDFAHSAQGLLELNACVRAYDPERFVGRTKPGLIGLQELVGMYLEAYLPKEQDVRCARWSGALATEQLECASARPLSLPDRSPEPRDFEPREVDVAADALSSPADAANDVYASLLVLRAIQAFSDLAADAATADLRRLSTTPYNPWASSTYPRPAAPTSASSAASLSIPFPDSTLPADARRALTDRKFEALALFHDEHLALRDLTARMSASTPLKPVSAAWNVLGAVSKLRERGVAVEWDVPRLVALVDEVASGSAKSSMLREHGGLLEELKAGTPAATAAAA